MECNRGEAERCILIAKSLISSDEYEKAEKILHKAEHLFPSQISKDLLKLVREIISEEVTKNKKEGVRERKNAKNQAYANDPNLHYSQQQIEMVRKIIKCKDYYEMLGITKNAKYSDIKIAYRKIAKLIHPDKNKAPHADEAFKAIGKAVSVLSDSKERSEYDESNAGGTSYSEEEREEWIWVFKNDSGDCETCNLEEEEEDWIWVCKNDSNDCETCNLEEEDWVWVCKNHCSGCGTCYCQEWTLNEIWEAFFNAVWNNI